MKQVKDNYGGKKVSVMGFGRSGKACANLLLNIGAKVFVSDHSENTNHEHEPRTRIEFEFGKHSERILDADMIVISPGVSLQHPIILKAKKRNIPVIGELEFASRFIENPIIGITGTNGKTTTAFLIQRMLESAGIDTVLCGNMGIPLSSVIAELKPSTVPILEVSTFQLETVETFRPWIGILLNITPDHLDRHKSFQEYKDLKLKLFSNQTEDDFAVLNFDDPVVRTANTRAQKLFFSCKGNSRTAPTIWVKNGNVFYAQDKLFSINELNFKWECLLPDYLAAILVGKILKLSSSLILEGLNSFTGVPHRLEDIGTIEKVRFINNSMCTNPEAFVSTLHSFKQPVILIAGGKEKKVDITPIVQAINEYTKYTVLIGETAPKLSNLLNTQHCSANTMEEAVSLAYAHASPGDTILLSPGFASFDWFRDFSERGEKFKEAVRKLKN
ncbi:UDP-N-acetylmuramoyl-L-alanine--D-glutamate ligase [candidate division WOR-3 bacterium]|nr:UDP-N-acetylmuramoyl-L-alanine--D-glutamate ligase [candidate division WOR-3 bacterium]